VRWPLALAGVVISAFVVTAFFTSRVTEWLVMTDEMQYVKLALAIAREGALVPEIHDAFYPSYNQLYPLLLAPVVGLLDMPDAFRVAHVLNALIMASTAVPAYLLARELVGSRPAALIAAALTVAVPWMAMAVVLMTEVVGYPAFLWAALAMQRALAEPSPRRDLIAGAAIVLATLARTQYVLLALAFPVAVVLHELAFAAGRPGERRVLLRAAVRRHVVLWGAIVTGLLVSLPLLATGRLSVLLGQYRATAVGDILPPGVARFAVLHFDLIVVGLGVIPGVLGIGWLLGTLLRPSTKALHAYAILAAVIGLGLALQVASFNLRFVNGFIQTRYLVPLAPLLILAAIACLAEPRRRWAGVVVAGIALAFVLPLHPYGPAPSPWFASPDTAFHVVLSGRTQWLGQLLGLGDLRFVDVLRWGTPVLALALAAVLYRAPRRLALYAVSAPLLVFGVAETVYVLNTITRGPNGARPVTGGALEGRDWIDRAVPGARAALMPVPIARAPVPLDQAGYFSQQLWWDTEFWNKAADQVYASEGLESYSAWPKPVMRVDERRGRLIVDDQRRYVVASASELRFGLRGARTVANTDVLRLLDVPRPYALDWSTAGLGVEGAVFGPFQVLLYGDRSAARRRLAVEVAATPALERPQAVVLRGGGKVRRVTVAPGTGAVAALTVCVPAGGRVPVSVSLPGAPRAPGDGPPPALPLHVAAITVTDVPSRAGSRC
jgi:hypothetical protein